MARWRPIVVAIDSSPESAAAAVLGSRLARAAGTSCHLVHAVDDPAAEVALALMPRGDGLDAALLELVGPRLRAALAPVPLEGLHVRVGRPANVVQAEVERLGAGLVVAGGKHHAALGRWLGGSTARDLARTASVPLLLTYGAPGELNRVLAGVDLSPAAEAAIREAERFASLARGRLRAVHVLERPVLAPDVMPLVDQERLDRDALAILERDVWTLLRFPGAERATRPGDPGDPGAALAAEAVEWRADLLVVGSHGKNWLDRLLLGTVTERLIDRLPTSLLVVPVAKPAAAEQPAGELRAAR